MLAGRSISFLLLACLASAACHAPLVLARPPTARRQQPLLALVLPPDSLAEVIVVDGGLNFLSLYQGVITIRILRRALHCSAPFSPPPTSTSTSSVV